MALIGLLLLLHLTAIYAASEESFEECATKRDVLLRALYETGNNLNELDRVFYPAEELPVRFVEVNYTFNNTGYGSCSVSYFWAFGGFLLIQPPSIFQFTSLLFSYPSTNDSRYLNLTLPPECVELIEVDENGTCSCPKKRSGLERLTQQVSKNKLMNTSRVASIVVSKQSIERGKI